MEFKNQLIIGLMVTNLIFVGSTFYYHNEYMDLAYPSGSMGSQIKNIEIIPDPWYYRDFDYIVIKYSGGKIAFGESNVPLEKIRNINWTPYVVHKNNKTYVYQNSWTWEWHTVERQEPGNEIYYSKVKCLDKLYSCGYGWNKYKGYLNRTEALERFGWL